MAKHEYDPQGDNQLDPGIKAFVEALSSRGIETFESCQGGEGHSFVEPTVRFYGEHYEGYRAFSIAKMLGMPVSGLRRYYQVNGDELEGPWWEMTFHTTEL